MSNDQLLALLRECRIVLDRYWFTTVDDGEHAEDYNNEDVIGLCNRLDVLLAEIGGTTPTEVAAEAFAAPRLFIAPQSDGVDKLLASVMRKVLLSEDMYVQDDDRLLLDGHVHGGITPEELEAVRRVLADREEWETIIEPIRSMPQQMEADTLQGNYVARRHVDWLDNGRGVAGPWRYYRDGLEITEDEFKRGVANAEG